MAPQRMACDQAVRIDIGGAAPGIDARSGANVLRKRIGENELVAGLGPIVGRRVGYLVESVGDVVAKTRWRDCPE